MKLIQDSKEKHQITLSEIIIQKIRETGPISFRDFMEISLYHPELGYYTSSADRIGRNGDYYTSPCLTPVFGDLIGKQIQEMWLMMDKPDFTIVEFGAGTGALCHDILEFLKQSPELYENLSYCIIEKSAAMREKESTRLHTNEKVTWHNSIQDLAGIKGCVLSNEVLDNFSVHKVAMDEELMEVYLDYTFDFMEVLRPAPVEVREYLQQLDVVLPKGFHTEVNLEATRWIKELASSLEKGFIITIDYGFLSNELYMSSRSNGTLMCYSDHKVNDRLFNNIGEQDITSHVNFSALHHWGSLNGLRTCGITTQGQFLRALGLTNQLREAELNGAGENNARILHSLQILLADMGSKFKVLIQQKGLDDPKLLGLQFGKKLP